MIIIPARLASNRFPKKILANIFGTPMVVATAKRVQNIDKVVIATDSKEVVNICKKYGFEAVLTSDKHKSGTDRINEAADILNLDKNEPIINLQADEPFIEPEIIKKVYDKIKSSPNIFMVSCYKIINKDEANDPNHVKVITNSVNEAIYFSRSKIPYDREEHHYYYGHLGIYGFTKKSLSEFCSLHSSPLEDIEKLEQLRAVYHKKPIYMLEVKSRSFGIDTKDDLKRALREFR